uniref:Uncharacterized protein n=1 Tax=Aegilops tauschii subsp. strangulata TaxID=200361 RepID=A0A453E5V4_AEGTS
CRRPFRRWTPTAACSTSAAASAPCSRRPRRCCPTSPPVSCLAAPARGWRWPTLTSLLCRSRRRGCRRRCRTASGAWGGRTCPSSPHQAPHRPARASPRSWMTTAKL